MRCGRFWSVVEIGRWRERVGAGSTAELTGSVKMVEGRVKRLRGYDCERVDDVFGEAHSQGSMWRLNKVYQGPSPKHGSVRGHLPIRDRTCLLCVMELEPPVGGGGLDQNYHLTYTSKDCCLSNGRGVGVKPALT